MNNLFDFFSETCGRYADKILFDNIITYADAFSLAVRRAMFLKKEGYRKGDVIGILAENSAEWCITYMALTISGIITVPMDPNLSSAAYENMIKTVKMKAVFISDIYGGHLRKIKKYPVILEKCMQKKSERFNPPQINEDYPAAYIVTSGTTGTPKIVILTHSNVYNTSISTSRFLGIDSSDRFLNILPLFHAYAFVANFTGPFAQGVSFYFLRSLKGPDIVRTLGENEFTIFPAAPQLWELFMDSILNKAKSQSILKYRALMFFLKTTPFFRAIGLGFIPSFVFKPVRDIFGRKIKYFVSGGAPLKLKYYNYYKRMGLKILEGYGLSETTGPVSICHPDDTRPGSVGPPMPGNEVQIRNINSDGIGEIWLRGISVMSGYYRNREANKAAFDADGWFNSGDLGRTDKDNYIYITGRDKNVIVLDSGKNVYPEELESFYKRSPMIAEISVFGRKISGRETVYAVIVPADKTKNIYMKIKDEINRLNRGLPSYKIIENFSISLDPLPVNSTRKVLVHETIKFLEKGMYQSSPGDTCVPQNEVVPLNSQETDILTILLKRYRTKKIFANETFQDYGIDSLALIDLVAFLEESLGILIDLSDVKKLNTMEEFIRFAGSCKMREGMSIDERIFRNPRIKKYFTFQNFTTDVFIFFLKRTALRFWNLNVSGIENIPAGNFILTVNHQSNLDYPLISSIIPKHIRRRMFVIGKKELSFMKFIFPGSNVIFVDRGGDVVPSLKASSDILRQEKSLCIFPEGTRSKDGNISAFKAGASYLSKNLGKVIVPVIIDGTGRVMPKGRFLPYFKNKYKIKISILPVLDPGKFKDPEMMSQKLKKLMSEKLSKMRSE